MVKSLLLFCRKNSLWFLWSFIGFYVLIFSLVTFSKFYTFVYNDFDFAIYSQIMWNLLHGSMHSSILGINFLGSHNHLILFLIVPIYKIFPHPLTLLSLQTLVLGLGAYPLYLLARSVLGRLWALLISSMYLIYPGLGYTNLFEFHPPVFATFFLLYMLYFFYKGRFGIFVIFMFLSMLCQENIPLAVVMMGFYALAKRRGMRWIILPIAAGAIYFWLFISKITPTFNKNTIEYISIYRHLGNSYFEIFLNITRHPFQTLSIMLTPCKISYLIKLFIPLLFIPLLSPLSLMPVAPFLMQHLLSLRQTETSIYFHYTAEMIPFIFFALVFGVKYLLSSRWIKRYEEILGIFLLVVSIGANFYFGPHFILVKDITKIFQKSDEARLKEKFLKKIPEDAAVVATFKFLPVLSQRKDLYSFHHLYMGHYTLSQQSYNIPEQLEYALLDFNDDLTFRVFYDDEGDKSIRRFLTDGAWGVSDVKDTIVLFQKDAEDKIILYSVLPKEPVPENKVWWTVAEDIALVGYDIKEREGNFLHITFYWYSLRKTDRDINVFFDFIDKEWNTAWRSFRPICYRILPTSAWQPGKWIKEERYLLLPTHLKADSYFLKMGFYNHRSKEIYNVDSQDPLGRIRLKEILI